MTQISKFVFAMFIVFAAIPAFSADTFKVIMQTETGDIELEVDALHAPISAQNFLRYVREGFYESGMFHRTVKLDNQPDNVVKIEVIQGGTKSADGAGDYPPIPLERTSVTGLQHLDGTLSMARAAVDTATSEFFICINDQPELDFGGRRNPDGQGFAAFGHVTKGMDIVRGIQNAPATAQTLNPPIYIKHAFVVEKKR